MRPTKYNNQILQKAKCYIYHHEKYGDIVPSISGLASILEIAKSTIMLWQKDSDKKEFSDTLEQIKNKQERILINNGLNGSFNSTITKLMLHNFGYSDKKQVHGDHRDTMVIELKTDFDDPADLKGKTDEELRAIAYGGKS